MDKRTKGAWLINHGKKLGDVSNPFDFEDIEIAGKCGVFLASLASDTESEISPEKVKAIARVSRVKKSEFDTVTNLLKRERLIETGADGTINVLGVTTSAVLEHTAEIFDSFAPNNLQQAALEISESVSDLPKQGSNLAEYVSDTFELSGSETADLLTQSEDIGFVDFERFEDGGKLYFNGNWFRRDNINRTNKVLSTLKSQDTNRITEVDQMLVSQGCISLEDAERILGPELLGKLQAIGLYDVSEVSNTWEAKAFVTKPSAFSKYGNPFEEDALDLAKAFVSSLYYGMNYSSQGRGRITLLSVLLRKLINGFEVGPATAIGQDYKVLELHRVVELRRVPSTQMFYMKLLKKDIGELALQVLEVGDAAEKAIERADVYTGDVTDFKGPERMRNQGRKRQTAQSKKEVSEILRTFRT